jgi:8-oxo-dGTP pyrophosphatase MutT (NUDIX family)
MQPDMNDIIHALRERLLQPLPGRAAQERMTGRLRPLPDVIPDNARDSAVLQLLYPIDNEMHLLFIRRTEDGRAHSGQISFPGGRHEPEDASFMITALREAEEEVGIVAAEVEVLGGLTPLYIPVSYFMVHPFVAWSPRRPDYLPSKHEVSEILEIPISHLFNHRNKITTDVKPSSMPGTTLTVPAYNLPDGTFIWGATAMMLSELEEVFPNQNP